MVDGSDPTEESLDAWRGAHVQARCVCVCVCVCARVRARVLRQPRCVPLDLEHMHWSGEHVIDGSHS